MHVLTATKNIFSAFLKSKFHPTTGHEVPQAGVEIYIYSFFNFSARLARVINITARALYPRERNRLTIVQKAG
jgi:hypothetical protein